MTVREMVRGSEVPRGPPSVDTEPLPALFLPQEGCVPLGNTCQEPHFQVRLEVQSEEGTCSGSLGDPVAQVHPSPNL